ncbi:hypothetical protein HPB47_008168 [Ixodes persulcatus]|uniref:Uncharacterized protein n=1 Tax=Ixodes persulcatus TaxID=34615 RepID=A0AC60P5S9_IXOPE|nr:hypothetical protein HPB47_008168 [Ixodes persulcatus]
MPPRVPLSERRVIARLCTEGVSQREICRRTGRSKTAVSRIIKAFRDEEGRISDADRSGRPKKTDEEEERLIIAAAVADPFLSAREIRDELQLTISCHTIRRRLKEAGLHNCVAAQKPHLTDRQRRQRLELDDFRQVIFTDDKDGLGPLVRIDGRFNAPAYCDMIEQTLLPYALDGPFPDGVYLLQHDRSPIHTARKVDKLLEARGVRQLEGDFGKPRNGRAHVALRGLASSEALKKLCLLVKGRHAVLTFSRSSPFTLVSNVFTTNGRVRP